MTTIIKVLVMGSETQPFEQDIEWLIQKSKEKNLQPPTESSQETFAERLAIECCNFSSNESVEDIRKSVFSEYLCGNVGDVPEWINE